MAFNQNTQNLMNQIRNRLGTLIDQVEYDLIRAWVNAWDELADELETTLNELTAQAVDGRVSGALVRRSQNVRAALDQAANTIRALVKDAGVLVTDPVLDLMDSAISDELAVIRSQLPPGIGTDFMRPPADALDAMVNTTTGTIVSQLDPLTDDMLAALRGQLLRGITVGDNPRQAARDLLRRLEGDFNGGLSRAMRIMRTEFLDAHREATRRTDLANPDTVTGWRWLTRLDGLTCRSCVAMNGQQFPPEEPGPQDHPNGRCARVPTTKSWEGLGFTGIEEPESAFPDAGEWFDNLDEATQKQILGAAGFEAWLNGNYPMSEWATRRENPGWRDSVVPTRVPR